MAYLTVAQFRHYDDEGIQWRAIIYQDGGTQDLTLYEAANPYFTLSHDGEYIKEGRFQLFWATRNQTEYDKAVALTGLLPSECYVVLQKAGADYWVGYIEPDTIEAKEGDYPRTVALAFKDGVVLDGEAPLQSFGGYTSLIGKIAEALGQFQPIRTYPGWRNTTACPGTTDDLYADIFIDNFTWRDVGQGAQDIGDDTRVTYRYILEQILQLTDAFVIQANDRWNVIQKDAYRQSSLRYFSYNSNGIPISPTTGTVTKYYTVGANTRVLPTSTAYYKQPLRQVSYTYNHRTVNTGFRFDEEGYVIVAGATVSFVMQYDTQSGVDSIYFKFRVQADYLQDTFSRVQAIARLELRIGNPASGSWRYWNGSDWQGTQTDAQYRVLGIQSEVPGDVRTVFSGEIEFKTTYTSSLDNGEIQLVLKPMQYLGSDLEETAYTDIEYSIIGGEEVKNSRTVLNSLTSSDNISQKLSLPDSIIGAGPTENSRGALRYYDGSASRYFTVPEQWKRFGVTETRSLSFMTLRSRLDYQRRARKVLRGNIYGTYTPEKGITYEGKNYIFDRGRISVKGSGWDGVYMTEYNSQTAGDVGATDNHVESPYGHIPGVILPVSYNRAVGIPALFRPDQPEVFRTDLTADGSGAPTVGSGGDLLPDGSIVFNTASGDTSAYRYERLTLYEAKNDFSSNTDSWVGITGSSLVLNTVNPAFGVVDNRGALIVTMVSSPSSPVEFGIRKTYANQEHKGAVIVQVYCPSSNTSTKGVQVSAGTTSSTTLALDQWVTLSVGNYSGFEIKVRGTNSSGSATYVPTFEDVIRVRTVSFFADVFQYTSISAVAGGQLTRIDPKSTGWTNETDILIARELGTENRKAFGFINNQSPLGVQVYDTSAEFPKLWQIVGRYRNTLTSISADVLTSGTLDASQVTISNFSGVEYYEGIYSGAPPSGLTSNAGAIAYDTDLGGVYLRTINFWVQIA